MKRLIFLLLSLSLNISSFSQAPQTMSFQAVIRNNAGQLVANHLIGMRITILQGSVTGTLLVNMISGYAQPAARVGDMHTCPLSSSAIPPVPHIRGPILPPGCQTVLIGAKPAARAGDLASCIGATDVIASGCNTVLIGGKPAARMRDPTNHGGKITEGFSTVLIGAVKGRLNDT